MRVRNRTTGLVHLEESPWRYYCDLNGVWALDSTLEHEYTPITCLTCLVFHWMQRKWRSS